MKHWRKLSLFVLALFMTAAMAQQEAGENISLTGTINDDTYSAGGAVSSSAIIDGDLVASGGQLTINGEIKADAIIAGGNISVGAKVGDDARIAGGQISIDADIGDDLMVAGGQITITPDTHVGGNAMVAGGQLQIAAKVDHDLFAAGGEVTISGLVQGDVEVTAEQLILTDSAVIQGKLTYTSPNEIEQHKGAVVRGGITYKPSDAMEYQDRHGVFPMVLLAITSLVFFFVFPRFSHAASGQIYKSFWSSLGLGAAMLLVTPFSIIIILMTVLGIWIGLSLLAAYLVLLLIGSVLGIVCSGEFLARLLKMDITKTWWRILSILLAVILLGVLQWVPIVGGLAILVIMLVGMGSATILLQRKYKGIGS